MNVHEARFDFYERVRVNSSEKGSEACNGRIGAVLGRAQQKGGAWHYSILLDGATIVRSFAEHELTSTGTHARREDFYDDTSIRVTIDDEGRGTVIHPDTETVEDDSD